MFVTSDFILTKALDSNTIYQLQLYIQCAKDNFQSKFVQSRYCSELK